jgi:molybdate transport system substrate-binding protein
MRLKFDCNRLILSSVAMTLSSFAAVRARLVCALLVAVSACGLARASAQDLTVAAASDLQSVLPSIVARFQHETGRSAVVTFGSSGNFFSQLQNGAPFDVFLSADMDYPRQLAAAGLADPATLYEYAVGAIVLWARKGAPVDIQAGLPTLLDPAVRRIAIANPAHAPYGRAAVAALQHDGLYDRVREKLVFGENVSQAAQFVQSGNADAGIIALSVALAPALATTGTSYEIPASLYPPIAQAAVVMRSSRHPDAAVRFLEMLKQPDVVSLMRTFGFAVPPTAARPK